MNKCTLILATTLEIKLSKRNLPIHILLLRILEDLYNMQITVQEHIGTHTKMQKYEQDKETLALKILEKSTGTLQLCSSYLN